MLILNDVCTLITDGSHFSPEDEGTGYPMLSVKDMCDDHFDIINCKYVGEEAFQRLASNGCRPQVNDVVVAKDGSFLKTAFTVKEDQDIALLSSIAILRPKLDLIVPDYLSYYLKSPSIYRTVSLNYISGTALKRIILKGLRKIPMEVPKLEEQYQRVELLNSLKQIIKQRKAEIQKLDDLIKARFVEMFGDIKTNTYGWQKYLLEQLTIKITDGEHGTVPRVNEGEGYLYFMARNITKEGLIDLSETSYVPVDVHQKIYKRCNPEAGDILLVCVGATVGKSALVTEKMGEFSMARSVALIKPDKEKINSLFLLNLLRSDAIQNNISNCVHAAAQAGLYTNMIKNLDAFVPPIELQNQFADFVKQVDKLKLQVQKSLDETQLLFDSLMQQYFG